MGHLSSAEGVHGSSTSNLDTSLQQWLKASLADREITRASSDRLRVSSNPFASQSLDSPVKVSDLLDMLDSRQVTLWIGPQPKPVRRVIPEQVLCQIPYFENCFRNGFQETIKSEFHLPEEDPKAVERVLSWIFRGVDYDFAYEFKSPERVSDITGLIILADKWQLKSMIRLLCWVWYYLWNTCRLPDFAELYTAPLRECHQRLSPTRFRFLPVWTIHTKCVENFVKDEVCLQFMKRAFDIAGQDSELWTDFMSWFAVYRAWSAFSHEDFMEPLRQMSRMVFLEEDFGYNSLIAKPILGL